MELLNGKKIAEKISKSIKAELDQDSELEPNLAIVLAGERKDSELYVKIKEKQAKKVGIITHLYRCSDEIEQADFLEMLEYLKNDDEIDAILVQLPLPKHLDVDLAIKTVGQEKDVDGFHEENLKLLSGNFDVIGDDIISPVFLSVLRFLEEAKFEGEDKKALILTNSEIFGKNLKNTVKKKVSKVDFIIPQIKEKFSVSELEKLKNADLIITALGCGEIIKGEMIKDDAGIIDIGISEKGKKVVGDVDAKSVEDKVNFLTPVPGGVGPLTVVMLLQNTVKLARRMR